MDPDALVDQLSALGLTRNQSLAYLTLLEDDGGEGLTGYEVGARSGVPRSAVYNVLRQLEEAGAAFSVGDEPMRFIAAEPDGWVDRVRRTTASRLDAVARLLEAVPRRSRPEPLWIVRRYDEVLDVVADLIRAAERSVWLSLWRREIDRLRPVLEEVADRDLHRVLHSPEPILDPPRGFSCWIDEHADAAKAAWSHKAIVVVDRREALIGGAEPDADNDAVRTTNPSLVDVATNHLILDVTLLAQRTGRRCDADVAPMMRPHLSEGRGSAPPRPTRLGLRPGPREGRGPRAGCARRAAKRRCPLERRGLGAEMRQRRPTACANLLRRVCALQGRSVYVPCLTGGGCVSFPSPKPGPLAGRI